MVQVIGNKCSDKSMEELLPALLGNNDGKTRLQTNQPIKQQTDIMDHREGTLACSRERSAGYLLFAPNCFKVLVKPLCDKCKF